MSISRTSGFWRRSLVWGVLGLVLGFAEAQRESRISSSSQSVSDSTTLVGPTSSPTSSQGPPTSNWTNLNNITLYVPGFFSYKIHTSNQSLSGLQLVLCRTDATDSTQSPTANDLFVVDPLTGEYYQPTSPNGSINLLQFVKKKSQQIAQPAQPAQVYNSSEFPNFFFCLGSLKPEGTFCQYYSPYFNITSNESEHTSPRPVDINAVMNQTPGSLYNPINIYQNSSLIVAESALTQSVGLSTATPSIPTNTTQPLSTTTASTNSTSATATAGPTIPIASKSSSSGLSTGAKVGIALGSLVVAALLLLLALFFLRRKHAQRNNQAATHRLHTDSFPHSALIAEKDDSSPSTIIPIPEPLLVQRHPDTQIPYTAIPSSTSPPTTTYNTAVPKRKPTANTVASTVSRGLSTISRSSGPSANGSGSGSGVTSSSNFESYRDAAGGHSPTYGDARQSPQVFTSNALREEGMTPEEVARLEEEERRIDAAIAEAERR